MVEAAGNRAPNLDMEWAEELRRRQSLGWYLDRLYSSWIVLDLLPSRRAR